MRKCMVPIKTEEEMDSEETYDPETKYCIVPSLEET
jgi:hypothetical protein